MSPATRSIQITDQPELSAFDASTINKVMNATYDKIQRIIHNELLLAVHFKRQDVGGRRAKHTVRIKASFPGKTLVSSESGWNVIGTLQKALHCVEREAIKAVKKRQK